MISGNLWKLFCYVDVLIFAMLISIQFIVKRYTLLSLYWFSGKVTYAYRTCFCFSCFLKDFGFQASIYEVCVFFNFSLIVSFHHQCPQILKLNPFILAPANDGRIGGQIFCRRPSSQHIVSVICFCSNSMIVLLHMQDDDLLGTFGLLRKYWSKRANFH